MNRKPKHRGLRTRISFWAAACLLAAAPSVAGAQVLWDESVNGDADLNNPTPLTLATGENIIRGHNQVSLTSSQSDFDAYFLTIPPGASITAVALSATQTDGTGMNWSFRPGTENVLDNQVVFLASQQGTNEVFFVFGNSLPIGDGVYRLGNDSAGLEPGVNLGEGDYEWTFTVAMTDSPPTANAGPDQSVRMLGETVTLDGSASFDDNTASGDLQYAWQLTGKPATSAAALTGANTAAPSFVADAGGTYTASLIVTDSIGQTSEADDVMVSTANLAPTADAGADLVVPVGDIVVLDGSASSDPEGMALSYAWTLSAVPAGSNATLANTNSAGPNLIPDRAGLYEATLVVSDNLGPSAPDSAEITAVARGDFASMKIACAADLIAGLPEDAVKAKGNQKALLNYLAAAAKAVQRPDYEKAIERIEFALQRTDGCSINGVPDGNGAGRDWVETCAGQLEIDRCLNEARGALE